jgi:hypothetical protein
MNNLSGHTMLRMIAEIKPMGRLNIIAPRQMVRPGFINPFHTTTFTLPLVAAAGEKLLGSTRMMHFPTMTLGILGSVVSPERVKYDYGYEDQDPNHSPPFRITACLPRSLRLGSTLRCFLRAPRIIAPAYLATALP